MNQTATIAYRCSVQRAQTFFMVPRPRVDDDANPYRPHQEQAPLRAGCKRFGVLMRPYRDIQVVYLDLDFESEAALRERLALFDLLQVRELGQDPS